MFFIAPNQVFSIQIDPHPTKKSSGWMLLIHLISYGTQYLQKRLSSMIFFDYSVNEALFLSEKEEKTLNRIIENIRQEYHSNIDKFSKQIIVSHIEHCSIIPNVFTIVSSSQGKKPTIKFWNAWKIS